VRQDSLDLSQSGYSRLAQSGRDTATERRDYRDPGVSLADPSEINLAKRLCQFGETVPQVLNDFRPNILANYLFELANGFHAFYEACPVLKSEEPARSSRLALCELAGRIWSAASIFSNQSAREDVKDASVPLATVRSQARRYVTCLP